MRVADAGDNRGYADHHLRVTQSRNVGVQRAHRRIELRGTRLVECISVALGQFSGEIVQIVAKLLVAARRLRQK